MYFLDLPFVEIVGDSEYSRGIDFAHQISNRTSLFWLNFSTLMVSLVAIFQHFLLVAVPKPFELPLLIIWEQAGNRLVDWAG